MKIIEELKDFIYTYEKQLDKVQRISETNFDNLKLVKRGKVRDIYEVEGNYLIVSTDRISAFDVVLPNPIPLKGIVLNMISYYWFEFFKNDIQNHLISADVDEYPEICKPYKDHLRFRSVLVKKQNVYPVECIVRGYLAGSGYEEYKKSRTVCGIQLPEGLTVSSKLPEPIFTPSTKAEVGHDENITLEKAREIVGDVIDTIKDKSIYLYKKASEHMLEKGIIIADTKFEFGYSNYREITLIDEVLTPDSSRFWYKETYKEGVPQESYDKQYVRDYLKSVNWDKKPPAPELPEEVIINTSYKYLHIMKMILGI